MQQFKSNLASCIYWRALELWLTWYVQNHALKLFVVAIVAIICAYKELVLNKTLIFIWILHASLKSDL